MTVLKISGWNDELLVPGRVSEVCQRPYLGAVACHGRQARYQAQARVITMWWRYGVPVLLAGLMLVAFGEFMLAAYWLSLAMGVP